MKPDFSPAQSIEYKRDKFQKDVMDIIAFERAHCMLSEKAARLRARQRDNEMPDSYLDLLLLDNEASALESLARHADDTAQELVTKLTDAMYPPETNSSPTECVCPSSIE